MKHFTHTPRGFKKREAGPFKCSTVAATTFPATHVTQIGAAMGRSVYMLANSVQPHVEGTRLISEMDSTFKVWVATPTKAVMSYRGQRRGGCSNLAMLLRQSFFSLAF